MSSRIDVAVVGAGPAGSWAAYRLARAGARVTLFDASHPREKPCGGGVTRRALRIVADAIAPELPTVSIHSAAFEDPNGTSSAVHLNGAGTPSDPALVVASRRALDAALLDAAVAAGATLVTRRVVEVSANTAGAQIRTREAACTADWLLGADGANSLVRRCLGAAFRRSQLSIATGYFAHGVSSQEIVIQFVPRPAGYIWSFPRPDHLAIGICAQADEVSAPALKRLAREWIVRSGIAGGARLEPYSWPIPSLTVRDLDSDCIAGPRWMLLGDAAGFVDPITREGIYFALRSADFAAEAIVQSSGPAQQYQARVDTEIYPELRRAARWKAGFFRPQFIELLVSALRSSAAVRTVMADLISGEQQYHGLERRLLATLEWRLAWRLLQNLRRPDL